MAVLLLPLLLVACWMTAGWCGGDGCPGIAAMAACRYAISAGTAWCAAVAAISAALRPLQGLSPAAHPLKGQRLRSPQLPPAWPGL